MSLDPVVQTIIDRFPQADDADSRPLAELRRESKERSISTAPLLREPPGAVARVEEHKLRAQAGEFSVRVYTPEGDGPFPALVFIHGGAWWAGGLDQADFECRDLAANAACVVVSVDYHLAPEFPFPAPLEDCYAAIRWVVEQARSLRVDASRVAVGGSSAGGNLAAGVALLARDRGGPALCFQLLEIPATDPRMETESMREFAEGYLLTRADMERGWGFYLPDAADRRNPHAAPALAQDLRGLPPALIVTCEFDPLRDEAEAYGARLIAAGVPVELARYPGMIHGSQTFSRILSQARGCRRHKDAALRRAFEA